jgi:DNA-directed RNA polymerase subunit RPC12/RpoP
MGGIGSGRCGGLSSAPTCESTHSIDLAYLRRRGHLNPGHHCSLTWSRGGEQTGSIGIIVSHDGIRLNYAVTDRHGVRISINELVPFAYTATRFNGRRQWLTCLKCGRRCRKIYGGRYFRCRQCHGLVHASTREPAYQRALDRAEGMRKRLGAEWGSAFEGAPLPPKPPRMRWVTYRRLEAQYEEQQNRWAVGVKRRFGIVA